MSCETLWDTKYEFLTFKKRFPCMHSTKPAFLFTGRDTLVNIVSFKSFARGHTIRYDRSSIAFE